MKIIHIDHGEGTAMIEVDRDEAKALASTLAMVSTTAGEYALGVKNGRLLHALADLVDLMKK